MLDQICTDRQVNACQDAVDTLTANFADCTATADDTLVICTGQCRQYYDDIIANCDESVSLVIVPFSHVCAPSD